MILLMNLFQSLPADMSVDLGCRDIHMAEHHLDRTQIGPPFQKMTREGVTKKVGSNLLAKAGLPRVVLQILPEPLTAHSFPRTIDK